MKLLVSGPEWIDIDAYACIIAYAEFLQNQKKQLVSCLTKIGYSPTITPTILSRPIIDLDLRAQYDKSDELILLDISGKKYIEQFYSLANITELRDHRKGDELFWQIQLGSNCHIEMVGSCTTLIYEYIKEYGNITKLSQTALRLLYTGTISNTLNLQGSVTTQRDRDCCIEISQMISLPNNWNERYFQEIDFTLSQELKKYLTLETKYQDFFGLNTMIVQCELWDSKHMIENYFKEIIDYMNKGSTSHWFFTTPSIKDNCNYIICQDGELKKILSRLIGVKFDGDLGITKKMWLRKEILGMSVF